jgi:hypothetical protein
MLFIIGAGIVVWYLYQSSPTYGNQDFDNTGHKNFYGQFGKGANGSLF